MNFEMITLCGSVSFRWRQWHSFRCACSLCSVCVCAGADGSPQDPDWRAHLGGSSFGPITDMTLIPSQSEAASRTWMGHCTNGAHAVSIIGYFPRGEKIGADSCASPSTSK